MRAGTKNEADGDAETWRGAARLREQTGAPTLAPRQTDRIPGPAVAAQIHSTQQEKRGTRTLTTARSGSVVGKKKIRDSRHVLRDRTHQEPRHGSGAASGRRKNRNTGGTETSASREENTATKIQATRAAAHDSEEEKASGANGARFARSTGRKTRGGAVSRRRRDTAWRRAAREAGPKSGSAKPYLTRRKHQRRRACFGRRRKKRNPSARRVRRVGPQRAGERTEWKSTKNENRAEIKAMNARRKIPDLEPTQSRSKLEIFQ
jgi:hypothetical protein